MKTFTVGILALAASLSVAAAAPSEKLGPRCIGSYTDIEVTFIAVDGQYTISVPYSDEILIADVILNPQTAGLGIDTVKYDHDLASCTFTGSPYDAPAAVPVEKSTNKWTGTLGPPQPITAVYCTCY